MNIKFNVNYVSKKYFVGSIHVSNESGVFRVLGKVDSNNFAVEFLNTGYITTAQTNNIKNGVVKDPLHPTVFGVGFIGAKKGTAWVAKRNGKMTKEYDTWFSMLRRCYSDKESDTYAAMASYKETVVCTRWHNFQNFCEDIQKLKGYNEWLVKPMHLDKDLSGQNYYSPETCVFLTPTENIKEMWERKHTIDFKLVSPEGEVHLFRNATEFAKKRRG